MSLSKYLRRKNIPQSEVAKALGIKRSMTNIVLNNPEKLTVARIRKIADVVRVSPTYIVSLITKEGAK